MRLHTNIRVLLFFTLHLNAFPLSFSSFQHYIVHQWSWHTLPMDRRTLPRCVSVLANPSLGSVTAAPPPSRPFVSLSAGPTTAAVPGSCIRSTSAHPVSWREGPHADARDLTPGIRPYARCHSCQYNDVALRSLHNPTRLHRLQSTPVATKVSDL